MYSVKKPGKPGVAGGPSSPTQQSGFVLDGFPTTDAQAAALEKYLTGLDLNVEEKKKKEKASRIAPPPPPVCRTCSFLATIWFKDMYVCFELLLHTYMGVIIMMLGKKHVDAFRKL